MTSRDHEPAPQPWHRPGRAPAHAIELPGHGWLALRPESDELWFTSSDGEVVDYPGHDLLHGGTELVWSVAETGGSVLIAARRADSAYVFDARERRFRRIPTVERLPQAEELSLQTAGDLFVLLTENGVIALDAEGRECWRISQTTWGWQLIGSTASELCFSDTNGNVVTVDRTTGLEASY
jgi:hypothetical protein